MGIASILIRGFIHFSKLLTSFKTLIFLHFVQSMSLLRSSDFSQGQLAYMMGKRIFEISQNRENLKMGKNNKDKLIKEKTFKSDGFLCFYLAI